MKRITLGIIAFFLTFSVSAVLVGLLVGFPKVNRSHLSYNSTAARNIKAVIEADISNGEVRRRAEYRLRLRFESESRTDVRSSSEHASIVSRYASKSAGIDVSRTPADFRYAWNRHMKAWKNQAAYSNALANNEVEFSSLSDHTTEINDTWAQVIRIARRYGVRIKPRYLR